MGKYHIPIEKQPILCTPKWLVENGVFCKNIAYRIMNDMKLAYKGDNNMLLYETRMAIPWAYAQEWLLKNYGLTLRFS